MYKLWAVSMTIPALSRSIQLCITVAMADRVARALNVLGADRDLFDSPDSDLLLEIIDDYLDNPVDSEGKSTP